MSKKSIHVYDLIQAGDIIEYVDERYDVNDQPYKLLCRAKVNYIHSNGAVNFTSIWAETIGTLYSGMVGTRRYEDVRKLSNEEVMLLKLEQ